MAEEHLLGIYGSGDAAARAIAALREKGHARIEALSPTPDHGIEAALGSPGSPVRAFTLVGGVLGGVSGLWLCIATSLELPLITGGKPIVSLPAFLVIAFEMTILLGALSTLLGFLIQARLPAFRGAPYDLRFSEDRYGVLVLVPGDQKEQARELLAPEAEEIRDV